ncbi:Prolyl 4-hydroxylase subunit alpha-1 [Thelohanellus kitauei]|uniref:Prolyl 4-hydroxylase subunit alpha-1 n=1 Tax=Thelohanellus kitauei TaxID=669202 RepID=A0A0C2MRX7_THEKT|nr:Prolyl 4-hydroxylase subunit alpha-1 [Thelohanellus kitauei]
MLRSIVNEDDIWYFKRLARNHLRTATVHNPTTGVLESADYRITQSSWFNIDSDPVIRKMKYKIMVATGLTLQSSEDLQLANYGIGGYYDTHFDYARKTEPSINDTLTRRNGGRLATYLLYMSDVTIGGKTGFPRLGISVQPSKGDALFWYNLFPDESGDARTRHIACPVALGTKWVGNFWIRSRGEDRSKPCSLYEQNGI